MCVLLLMEASVKRAVHVSVSEAQDGSKWRVKLFFFIPLIYYHTMDSEVEASTKATRASDHAPCFFHCLFT